MKRRVVALLSAGFVALSVTPASASAGDRVWTATACYAEQPYNAAWLGTPGLGANYSSVFAEYDLPLQWITWNGKGQSYVQVLAETHAYYAAAGYECGRFGLPYKQGIYESVLVSYRWTYFVKPGSCDMRYIIDIFDGGLTLEGAVPDYFCQ